MCKTLHGAQRSRTHLYCICFCLCGRQKPEEPQFKPMADDAITQGDIGDQGSPVCIYDSLLLHT